MELEKSKSFKQWMEVIFWLQLFQTALLIMITLSITGYIK